MSGKPNNQNSFCYQKKPIRRQIQNVLASMHCTQAIYYKWINGVLLAMRSGKLPSQDTFPAVPSGAEPKGAQICHGLNSELNSANREGLWKVSSNCCYPKQCFSPSQKRTPWRMFPEVFWSDSITQGSTEPLFFKHSFKRGKKDDLGHLALAAFSEPILFAAASSDRKQSMFLLKRMQDTGKDRWLLSLWDGFFCDQV